MLHGPGLLVSLPARELQTFAASGSLFDLEELRRVSLSTELRHAIDLAKRHCVRGKVPLRFVARPEIFTHGDSLDWLKERIGGISDHLCISDGTSFRPIPHMRNHLFLYRTGMSESDNSFQQLCRCAPELFARVDSQVNTTLGFQIGDKLTIPPWVLMQGSARKQVAEPPMANFDLSENSLHSALSASRPRARAPEKSPCFGQINYVPLTAGALTDRRFMKTFAEVVARCYADDSIGLVIRLPRLDRPGATVKERLELIVASIRKASHRLAHVRTRSLLYSANDVPANCLRKLGDACDLWMHASFEFWRHSPEYYAQFRALRVIGAWASDDRDAARQELLTAALGRTPEISDFSGIRASRGTARTTRHAKPIERVSMNSAGSDLN